eukprot:6181393-Pleurochrysis_carterae.AAC.3
MFAVDVCTIASTLSFSSDHLHSPAPAVFDVPISVQGKPQPVYSIPSNISVANISDQSVPLERFRHIPQSARV